MSQEQLQLRAQTHPNIPSTWFNRFNLAFSACQYRMRPIERPWAGLSYPPFFRTRPSINAPAIPLWRITMLGDTPKQAFAAREAHEALLELKKLVDEATVATHAAELESFCLAVKREQTTSVRQTLEIVIERLKSPNFDAVLSMAREKLETAVSV